MRTPAPCLRRLSASLARLPHAAASDAQARGCAIAVDRPLQHGLRSWVTSSWGPLGAPTAAAVVAGAEDGTATAAPIPGARVEFPPAAASDGLHPEDPSATGQHLAPHTLELPPAHDCGHRAVLARHGPRQRRLCAAGRGALEAPTVFCTSRPRYCGRGGQAPLPLGGESL